ncbi:MAG: universal stress protein, partial [Verrucomicrobiota bacterium]
HPRPQPAVDAVCDLLDVLDVATTTITFFYSGARDDMPSVSLPRERPGWMVSRIFGEGIDVVDETLDASEVKGADLVAMATSGHHGFLDALRGSTTERVLRDLRCPLLAVPSS